MSSVSMKFRKHRISFSSYQGSIIFGKHFKSGKAAIAVAARLLISDYLNKDGTFDRNHITDLKYSDVWSYIYYLYSFNNEHIPEFKQMKGIDGQASAERFYDVVKSLVNNSDIKIQYFINKLNTVDLVYFVDKIIAKYGDLLINPVINHYNDMLSGNYDDFLKNFNVVVRTGRDDARIIRDPRNVANSDIIISISMKDSQ